jgi:Uma2 family endonuclease
MATNPRSATVTLEDFIAAAEASAEPMEFVGGQIVAVTGSSLEHGIIAANLIAVSQVALRPRGCRAIASLVSARPDEGAFLPDLVAYCGTPLMKRVRGVALLLNPVLLAEVLSPSTADYDHGTKWQHYRRIESLQEYLLVHQDQPRVERFTRQGGRFWLFSEAEGLQAQIQIESLGITLALADIYEGVFPVPEAGADEE